MFKYILLLFVVIGTGNGKPAPGNPPTVRFTIQKRVPAAAKDSFKVVNEIQEWNPIQTAVVICDMWDRHWCNGASERVAEMAPHMNRVLNQAREKGMLIVHAPSDCMKFYENYPQRRLSEKYALPDDKAEEVVIILPAEKNAVWPIDQSNGGCNDTPRCTEKYPWTRQTELINISEEDVITDSGLQMMRMFREKNIDRVILMGVHTNMCIVNRPFGLRNMISYGFNVVLMRDLTDVMYDARQAPYVNHFDGLGLMVEYIEKYIAPTVQSTDLTGMPPFHFLEDPRAQ